MAAYRQRQTLDVGARAPDFRLQDGNGHTHALTELLPAGPVLLGFFKVSCPVCQYTFPFLERIYKSRADSSLLVYGVSQDDARDTRDFNRQFTITFPTLLDPEDSYPASNAYGLAYVPSAFLIERDGTISWTMEGFNKKALESLGAKFGVSVFRPGEKVPEAKSG